MARRLLDTSVLVSYWHHRAPDRLETVDTQEVLGRAEDLIRLHASDLILIGRYLTCEPFLAWLPARCFF